MIVTRRDRDSVPFLEIAAEGSDAKGSVACRS